MSGYREITSAELASWEHDPTGRACAIAGRVNSEDEEYSSDACVACMTEEARHEAGMHIGEYGAWFTRQSPSIPLVYNGDCGRCEDIWYRSQQGE